MRGLTYDERKAVYEKEREIQDCEGEIGMLERCLALVSIVGKQRASYTWQLEYHQNQLKQLKAQLMVLQNPNLLDVIKGKA
jgi:hypothetical protein